ncbi:MAG: YihY/virulence factor BrkB family protein [Clostridia bacterium]
MVEKKMRLIINTIKDLIENTFKDEVGTYSAQLAFFLTLSIFPFLIFLINFLSFTDLGGQALVLDFTNYLPLDIAKIIESVVTETVQASSGTIFILAILGTIWTSSKGARSVIRGLNRVYGVNERRSILRLYVVSAVFVVALMLMITLSITLIVFGEVITQTIFDFVGYSQVFSAIWPFLRYGLTIAILMINFGLLYKYAPNKKVKFKNVWKGSVFAIIGWVLVSRGFAFYVNNFANYQLVYGSLGGLIVFLLWLYFSSMVILIGGEINKLDIEKKESS